MVFVLFLAGLASQTILPEISWHAKLGLVLEGGSGGGLMLQPGKILVDSYRQWRAGNPGYFWINLVGNVVMFMPLGLCPPLLWEGVSLRRAAAGTFCVSLFIELCQLFLPRWTDVDDLWLNTLGGVLGYGIWSLLRKIQPQLSILFRWM